MEITLIILSAVLGLLVGSFLNVVIYRIPAKKSIVFPRSSCPNCGHTLGALELVPVFSWLALGRKCKQCKTPISARYPLVETLTGLLFGLAAWRVQDLRHLVLIFIFTGLLVALSFIDFDTFELPWEMNFAGVLIGLLAAGLSGWHLSRQLALEGALMSAGLIAMFAGVGGLLFNKFKDGDRESPIGSHTMHMAAMLGALFGPLVGTVGGLLNASANARRAKPLALHDGITLGVALLGALIWAFVKMPSSIPFEQAGWRGMLLACGGVALAGGLYWWYREASKTLPAETESDYVSVMGFGDVILAGFLGAWLGFQGFLVAIMLAVFAGALIGVVYKRITGESKIPFGPYMAIGGLASFYFGKALVVWYLGYIGVA
jgi:leader peptidase (prepilin peptidase) / N-methyltransferase